MSEFDVQAIWAELGTPRERAKQVLKGTGLGPPLEDEIEDVIARAEIASAKASFEACAKIADEHAGGAHLPDDMEASDESSEEVAASMSTAMSIALSIRSRSQGETK